MKGYEQYIKDVLEGRITTCLYTRQLVERFERFRKRPDVYFDAACVDEGIDFLYQMKHWVGKSAGQHFELLPWQQFFFAVLMGLKWKADNKRVVRNVYLQCSRKQGKSSIIAALALYHLIADGEASPSVACLASTRDQARLIFEMITNYAKSIDPKSKYLKYYRNYIKMTTNDGECKVFSSDASKLDGLNVSMGIVDEYAVQPNNELYAKIKTSMGFREQPLMVCLTTPQGNLNSPAHKTYKVAIEILAGVKEEDDFWPFLYTLDVDDNWDDEECWKKSNPSLGTTVTMEFLRSEANAAKNDTSKLVPFKTLYAGMWCQSLTTWIPQEIVAKCMKTNIDVEEFRGWPCVIGMDLGSVSDFTSITALWVMEDKYYFKTWTWIPEATLQEHQNKLLYERFIEEGTMLISEGNCTDYNRICAKIGEISQISPVQAIYTDAWNAAGTMVTLQEMGFTVYPFSQSIGNFNSPTKSMERIIRDGYAVIDKSENILWQFGNVELKIDHNQNCLDMNTMIPTPNGFKQMKDIEIGDYVFSYDGTPTRVVNTTDVNYDRECYELTFSNGAVLTADAGHQWYVEVSTTKKIDGKRKTVTEYQFRDTEWLYNHYINGQGNKWIHTIMNGAVEYPEKNYSIDPYILGLWLGDGSHDGSDFAVNHSDVEIYDYVTSVYGKPTIRQDRDKKCFIYYYKGGLRSTLKDMGLLHNKHIPEEYFEGSVEQRLSLLQGMMDTDGTCNKINHQCSITQARKHLIEGVIRLLDSLGIRHSNISTFVVNGSEYYGVNFYTDIPVFRLRRKLKILEEYIPSKKSNHNVVMEVKKVDSVPTKCITVEDEKHLFLATDKYLVTGNCKPSKANPEKKIDSIISMCTALGGYEKEGYSNDFEIYSLI